MRTQHTSRSSIPLTILALFMVFASACVSRTTLRENERMLPSYPVSRAEALAKLESMSRAVQSLTTSVTIEARLGGLKSGKIEEYPPLPGTLVFQKPNHIRIQAKYIAFGAFDMVSDGETYQAYVPTAKKLFEGLEMGPAIGAIFPNALYNLIAELRPRQIKSALLIDILPYLENPNVKPLGATVPMPQDRRRYYVVEFIDVSEPNLQLVEKIWLDLSTPTQDIRRRQVFGKDGNIETDIMFADWKPIGSGTVFLPSTVDIQFPDKDLSVKLKIDFDGIALNDTIPAENFKLPPHPEAEVIRLEPRQATNLR